MDKNEITLKWMHIRQPAFNPALQKLMRQPLDFKTSLKILNIVKRVQDEQKKADEMFKIICEKHMELTPEKTSWVPREGHNELAESMLKEFADTEFKIKVPPIKTAELEPVEITVTDLFAIEPLLSDDTEVKQKIAIAKKS